MTTPHDSPGHEQDREPFQVTLIFRRLKELFAEPAEGELLSTPVGSDLRRDLAKLARERGAAGFRQGVGPVRRIVLPDVPTLDDMLAAEFLLRLLNGQTLPAGSAALAEYAAISREGLRPGELPLEQSLEGVYQAILNDGRGDLTKADDAARFRKSWNRLAGRIWEAAERGADPFTTPLCEGPEFQRERLYVLGDQELYQHDVLRGEQWLVRVPGGPPEAAGLLLREPKSLLFKHWARADATAPLGHGYLLLATHWGEGDWVFSTNPLHRLSLKPLAELLQTLEAKAAPDAAEHPWSDGAQFQHTMIATPRRNSRLPDATLLQTVQRWASARRWQPASRAAGGKLRRRTVLAASLAGGVAALTLPAWYAGRRWLDWRDRDRGLTLLIDDEQPAGPPADQRGGQHYALLLATNEYKHWKRLSNPILDAQTIAKTLQSKYGFETRVIENPTQEQFITELNTYTDRNFQPDDQLFVFVAGHGVRAGKEGFVVAHDTDTAANDPAHKSFVPHSRMKDIVEKSPCRHTLIVLDVCFGGTFDFDIATESHRGGGVYEKVSRAEFIRRKMRRPGKHWVTSGASELVPDGKPGQHSPFAAELLQALTTGGGKHGVLTVADIVIAVEQLKVTEPHAGTLRGHDGGDFLFIRKEPTALRPQPAASNGSH